MAINNKLMLSFATLLALASSAAASAPATVLGPFGMAPWGSSSAFATPSANWVWNQALNPTDYSTTTPATATFTHTFTKSGIYAQTFQIHVISDNTADVYFNGVFQGTAIDGGWLTTSYSKFPITLNAAGTYTVSFVVTNKVNTAPGGINPNPAGLLYSVRRDDGFVIAQSGTSTVCASC